MRILVVFMLFLPMSVLADQITQEVIQTGDDDVSGSNTGAITTGGTTIILGKVLTSSRSSGFRFQSIPIVRASTIDSARITFQSNGNASSNTVNITIYGEDTADATTFVASADLDDRLKTSASVAWSSIGSWTTGTDYATPELKTLVQEIVNRADWVSGNDMAFLIYDNSSSNSASRTLKAYETSTSACARLDVWYTPPAINAPTLALDSIHSDYTSESDSIRVISTSGGGSAIDSFFISISATAQPDSSTIAARKGFSATATDTSFVTVSATETDTVYVSAWAYDKDLALWSSRAIGNIILSSVAPSTGVPNFLHGVAGIGVLHSPAGNSVLHKK